jgi:putative hydrolase of the HAD superfamily
LSEEHAFARERTLFIDDNHAVLEAAAAFGIGHLLTIYQPDSARPRRTELAFPAFNDFAELIDG